VLDQRPINIDAHYGLVSACVDAISYSVEKTFKEAAPYISIAQSIASSLEEYIPVFHEEALADSPRSMSSLFVWLGNYFADTAAYQSALEWSEKARDIYERILGKKHPDTAASYNSLAGLHESMGSYDKALPLLEKAVSIGEKVLGKEHQTTKIFRENLNEIIALMNAKEGSAGFCDSNPSVKP
jgi:tetratricopeptide (TPR) repeat protein